MLQETGSLLPWKRKWDIEFIVYCFQKNMPYTENLESAESQSNSSDSDEEEIDHEKEKDDDEQANL